MGRELPHYDSLAVSAIVKNRRGQVRSCDRPFVPDPTRFYRDYPHLTREVAESCQNHDLPESMVIVPRDGTAGNRRKIFEGHGRLAGSNIF